MKAGIPSLFAIFAASVFLVASNNASCAERDCPMLEARSVTKVRVTLSGFGDRDQYGAPMQVNGTWDVPFLEHYAGASCQWKAMTPSGHAILFIVLDAKKFSGGAFELIVASPRGGIQAKGTKPLTGNPYGTWRMKPVGSVIAGTAQITGAVSGKQERPALSLRYVAADIANLREEPSAESKQLLRLRINSPLEVLETRAPWLKVVALGSETGWIREDVVLDRQLTVEEAFGRAGRSSGEERQSWLERTVALDPAHKAAWTALREACAASGKKDRAKAIERLLSGRERFFLAQCRNGDAELRVVYQPDGTFVTYGRETESSHPVEDLVPLVNEVAAWPWYAITKTSAVLLPGTPFPRPTVNTEAKTVVLGACHDELEEGEILATAPFVPEQFKAGKGGRYTFGGGLALQVRTDRKGKSWTVMGPGDKPFKNRDGVVAAMRHPAEPRQPATYQPGPWYRNRLSGVLYGTMEYSYSDCPGERDGDCGTEEGEWQVLVFPEQGVVESEYIATVLD